MRMSESIKNIAVALNKFQGVVTSPSKSTEGYNYKYATLDEVIKTIKKPLNENGLSFTQYPQVNMESKVVEVSTMLMHITGEYIIYPAVSIPLKDLTAQGVGAGITYGKRYSISAVLGIASEEDDDAASIQPKKNNSGGSTNYTITENQWKRLYAIANTADVDAKTVKEHVLKRFNKGPRELSKTEYDSVCDGYEKLAK